MKKHCFWLLPSFLLTFLLVFSCTRENIEHTMPASGPAAAVTDRSCGWQEVDKIIWISETESVVHKVWVYKPCSIADVLIPISGIGGFTPLPQPFFHVYPGAPDLVTINDVATFVDCMRPTNVPDPVPNPNPPASYEVGIFVQQPIPSSPQEYYFFPDSRQVDLGQSYLYLKKSDNSGTKEVYIAFMPTVGALGNAAPYVLQSNRKLARVVNPMPYTTGYKQQLSRLNYTRILNKIGDFMNTHPEYQVHYSNGVDFVLAVTRPLGLDLEPVSGNFPDGGTGNCSSLLGEKIRTMPAQPNVQIFDIGSLNVQNNPGMICQ